MSSRYTQLIEAVREAAGPRAWGAAVELARVGAVQGVSDDGEELHLRVKQKGRAMPHEVYLWPVDGEWGCDCTLPGDACLHVAASVIAASQTSTPEALPEPKATHAVTLRYRFQSKDRALLVGREQRWRALGPVADELRTALDIVNADAALSSRLEHLARGVECHTDVLLVEQGFIEHLREVDEAHDQWVEELVRLCEMHMKVRPKSFAEHVEEINLLGLGYHGPKERP